MAGIQGDNSDNHGWHKVSSHIMASHGLSRFIFIFVLQRYCPLIQWGNSLEGSGRTLKAVGNRGLTLESTLADGPSRKPEAGSPPSSQLWLLLVWSCLYHMLIRLFM